MKTRATYSGSQMVAAERAWSSYPPWTWDPWRELAKKADIIFPPSGSLADSCDVPQPSQRAIIVRAMCDTPDLLRWAILGAEPSWRSVVGRVFSGLDEMREQADVLDTADERRHFDEQPSLDEARKALERMGWKK